MKLYEKMGIDPTTSEGILQLMTLDCYKIPDKYGKSLSFNHECLGSKPCDLCKANRYVSEVQVIKIKRLEYYSNNYDAALHDFALETNSLPSEVHALDFINWLMEEIEVLE